MFMTDGDEVDDRPLMDEVDRKFCAAMCCAWYPKPQKCLHQDPDGRCGHPKAKKKRVDPLTWVGLGLASQGKFEVFCNLRRLKSPFLFGWGFFLLLL